MTSTTLRLGSIIAIGNTFRFEPVSSNTPLRRTKHADLASYHERDDILKVAISTASHGRPMTAD